MASGLVEGGFISEPQTEQPWLSQKRNGLCLRPTAEPSILAHLKKKRLLSWRKDILTRVCEKARNRRSCFSDAPQKHPDLFQDAGFMVILPFAKSVELHLRLLYLGSSENTFKNGNFTVKGALKSLEDCVENGDFESLSHQVSRKEVLYPHMEDSSRHLSRNTWKTRGH